MMAQHTILIVDDEANQRLMLTQALRTNSEREIATAASVAEALEWLKHHTADLIITDYNMPSANGLTLIAHVRQRALPVRIILITAYYSPELQEAARKLGVDHFLTKPVPLSLLRQLTSDLGLGDVSRGERHSVD
ncbi:MAG: response regulator [Roseiflexus sp.]|nr:response regulator [Roseiflexus sp.]MCS7290329.1 response regulator [Roseiflexus sp.]MDW8146083.1 response regulator [Roseiflexaceae bacterium]MDW8231255.1 response regulator [Roseiflexaceae bacterium]